MSWTSVKLSDLAKVSSGGGAPQDADAFSDEGIPFVRAGSLIKLLEGQPEDSLELLQPDVAAQYKLKLFPAGTVLFAKSGMSAAKGHIYQLRKPAYVVNHLAALVPRTQEDQRFLPHVLRFKSPTSLIKDEAYPSIRLGEIEEMEVPAPKQKNERTRIATILDQADKLRRKRQRAINRLNQLGQAIFYEMFGDPLGAPSAEFEWTTESLDSNVEFMDYRGKTPLKADSGIRLITARNVKMGFINLEPQEFVEVDSYDSWMTRGFPKKGDVLFTTEAPLGHVAQLDSDETVVIGQRLITMKPNRNVIRPTYLEFFLRTPSFRRKMFENSTGTTVVGIKSKLLKKINICYPEGRLQDNFDAAIHQLRATAPDFSRSMVNIEALFVSLQHRAFQGEL